MTRTYHTLTAPEPIPMKQLHWFAQFGHAQIPESWYEPVQQEPVPAKREAYAEAARKVVLTSKEENQLRSEILKMIKSGSDRKAIYLGLINKKVLPHRNGLPMSFKHVCRLIWAIKAKMPDHDRSKTKRMLEAFDKGERSIKRLSELFNLNQCSVRGALKKYRNHKTGTKT